MNDDQEMITVQVNLNITVEALQTVVANAKEAAGKDERGIYRVDTADCLGKMISQFLHDRDFNAFAQDMKNYT